MIVFQVKYFKWVRRKMKTNEPKKKTHFLTWKEMIKSTAVGFL